MARTKDQPQLPVFTTVETVYKPNEPIIALINQVASALGDGAPLFIQDTSPLTTSSKWIWAHLDIYGNLVIDVEDGKPGYSFYKSVTETFSTPDSVSVLQVVPTVRFTDGAGVRDSAAGSITSGSNTWNGYPSGSLVPSSTLTPYASGTTSTWNGYPSGSLVPSSTLTPYASGGSSNLTASVTDVSGTADTTTGVKTWAGYPSGSLVPSPTLVPV
jgi:hypothetical protein